MNTYYLVVMFIFGTIFGSFYNVVGERLPNNKSIIKPRSHCPKCEHTLRWYELIPVFSFIVQFGKCKNCKCKIPIIHPLFEVFSGLMFMLTFQVFNFTPNFFIAITFISILLIIIVSDINYYIIPDEVLIFGGILLLLEVLFFKGFSVVFSSLTNGIIAFFIMFLIKTMGDYIFNKESMGGGDIKLMFIFGYVLGWEMAIASIFLGSLIGFPISLVILFTKKTNIIPFGPFLSIASIIILLTEFNLDSLFKLLL